MSTVATPTPISGGSTRATNGAGGHASRTAPGGCTDAAPSYYTHGPARYRDGPPAEVAVVRDPCGEGVPGADARREAHVGRAPGVRQRARRLLRRRGPTRGAPRLLPAHDRAQPAPL